MPPSDNPWLGMPGTYATHNADIVADPKFGQAVILNEVHGQVDGYVQQVNQAAAMESIAANAPGLSPWVGATVPASRLPAGTTFGIAPDSNPSNTNVPMTSFHLLSSNTGAMADDSLYRRDRTMMNHLNMDYPILYPEVMYNAQDPAHVTTEEDARQQFYQDVTGDLQDAVYSGRERLTVNPFWQTPYSKILLNGVIV